MRRDASGLGIGVFFVAAGVLFLLDALEAIRLRASYLWPLLLIGFGLAVLAGGWRRPSGPEAETPPEPEAEAPPESPAGQGGEGP